MTDAVRVAPDAVTRPLDDPEPVYRRNFLVFLSDYILFSIGIGLVGSTTVIPDFIRRLTDVEVLIALSSQMFEILWLLPQLLVARQLVRVRNKKWWFIGPNIAARPMLILFAGAMLALGPDRATAILAAFLLFYGLAALGDGVVGVPWLDLVGSSLDARRRRRPRSGTPAGTRPLRAGGRASRRLSGRHLARGRSAPLPNESPLGCARFLGSLHRTLSDGSIVSCRARKEERAGVTRPVGASISRRGRAAPGELRQAVAARHPAPPRRNRAGSLPSGAGGAGYRRQSLPA